MTASPPTLSPAGLQAIQNRWRAGFDWDRTIPDGIILPEAHYMDIEPLGLTREQRVGLNRLAVCFTCELFIHFEGYVIEYMRRTPERIPTLRPVLIERFVAEEDMHTEAFRRLLHKLRPDLYPDPLPETRFLTWGPGDERALAMMPAGSFFLLALLFEEITLYVPLAMESNPEDSCSLVFDVMHQHAKEEESHVAIDMRVLDWLKVHQASWKTALQSVWTLPFLGYVDARVSKGWKSVVAQATAELGLSEAQQSALQSRGPSQSDRWGMESYIKRVQDSDIPGTAILCKILAWQLR